MNQYCNDCEYLSPTEEEQDTMKIKGMHHCGKLGVRVFHFNVHPHIIPHPNCPFKGKT